MKTFFRFVLIILLISQITGCNSLPQESLSEENLVKHVESFTSEEFEGRLMGSEGNKKAIDYINNYCDEIGLIPVDGETFTHDFKGVNYTFEGDLKFNVIESDGGIINSYKYGTDYIVRINDSAVGGKFFGDIEYIEKHDKVLRNEYNYNNLAVLLDYTDKSIINTNLPEAQVDDRIYYKDAKVIIYPDFSDFDKLNINVGSKSTFLIDKGIIKLGVEPDIYKDLVEYSKEGHKVDIDIPIAFHEVESANVVGMIEGRIKDYKNIIIATSFDGYGTDENGMIYPISNDNAASTSLFLELSRILKSSDKKYDANIVFLALNGTRLGDRGFDNYFRIDGIVPVRSEVIYLDKLGYEDYLTFGTHTMDSLKYKRNKVVFNNLISVVEDMHLEFVADEDYRNSDLDYFRTRGIISYAITSGDYNVEINYEQLNNARDVVLAQLENQGNINILDDVITFFKSIWLLIIIFIILGSVKYKYLKDREMGNLGKWISKKPIITVYLVIMFFLMVLIIQTKQEIMLTKGIPFLATKIAYVDILNSVFNNLLSIGFMVALIFIYILPLFIALISLRFLSDKVKFSKIFYIVIVGIIAYACILFGFGNFYSYEYSSIFPLFLALPNAHIIVILLIGLYSSLIIYFMNKEVQEISFLKLVLVFIFTYYVFFIVLYSPYIFDTTIINLRNSGGQIPY